MGRIFVSKFTLPTAAWRWLEFGDIQPRLGEKPVTQSLPGWGALFWVLDSSPRYLGVGG